MLSQHSQQTPQDGSASDQCGGFVGGGVRGGRVRDDAQALPQNRVCVKDMLDAQIPAHVQKRGGGGGMIRMNQ